ncbi:MAG: hypothetical protein DWQ07_06930 [Chloroflexi bacterium]|nr:MAG: hypothetical protein DWQ07_06930 [Chloroflexota bacterium]
MIIFHPFLAGLYPIFALLAININETRLDLVSRVLIVVILTIAVFWLLLFLLVKDVLRAAVISSLTIAFFSIYGHLINMLQSVLPSGNSLSSHFILLPIMLILYTLSLRWIRQNELSRQNHRIIQIFLLVLLLFPSYQIVQASIGRNAFNNQAPAATKPSDNFELLNGSNLPDIYVFVLDEYPRADALLNEFEFDNSEFVSSLEDLGFFVGECSRSNYDSTIMSLNALFNMNYIEDIVPEADLENGERSFLAEPLYDNTVRRTLEEIGYTSIAFQTSFYFTEFTDTTYYLEPNSTGTTYFEEAIGENAISRFIIGLSLNEFEWLVANTTGLRLLTDIAANLVEGQAVDTIYLDRLRKYNRILFQFDQVVEIPRSYESPKFVFTHILLPHEPFVFAPDGSFIVVREDYKKKEPERIQLFLDQVGYVNGRLLPTLETMIQNSASPPVIMLMADTGPNSPTENSIRNEILNAYYVPDDLMDDLYPEISPVNSFRLLFSNLFDLDYPLVEDKAYRTTVENPILPMPAENYPTVCVPNE